MPAALTIERSLTSKRVVTWQRRKCIIKLYEPIMKLMKLVNEVMVIDTAASLYVSPIRSTTVFLGSVRLQAASNTNVSSIPIPVIEQISPINDCGVLMNLMWHSLLDWCLIKL